MSGIKLCRNLEQLHFLRVVHFMKSGEKKATVERQAWEVPFATKGTPQTCGRRCFGRDETKIQSGGPAMTPWQENIKYIWNFQEPFTVHAIWPTQRWMCYFLPPPCFSVSPMFFFAESSSFCGEDTYNHTLIFKPQLYSILGPIIKGVIKPTVWFVIKCEPNRSAFLLVIFFRDLRNDNNEDEATCQTKSRDYSHERKERASVVLKKWFFVFRSQRRQFNARSVCFGWHLSDCEGWEIQH